MGIISRLNKAWKMLRGGDVSELPTTSIDIESGMSLVFDMLKLEHTRRAKYKDYRDMDESYGAEISASLDAYADTVMRRDVPDDSILKVVSNNENIVHTLNDLIYQLNLETFLWGYARSLAKYGDVFIEPVFTVTGDIKKLNIVDCNTVYVNYDSNRNKYPFVQKDDSSIVIAKFRGWELLHLKLAKDISSDYGVSVLQAARLPYAKLQYMEDFLFLRNICRSPKFVHKVDVTGLTPEQAKRRLEEYKKGLRKKPYINPTTGNMEYRKMPVNGSDDFFMGVSEDNGKYAGIDLVKDRDVIDLSDIEYMKLKMLTALKVPKQWLNIEVNTTKNIGMIKNLFFASSVYGIQLALLEGLYTLFDLALLYKGINVLDRDNDYTLTLPKQSTTDELIAARVDLIRSTEAKNYLELGIIDREFVLRNIKRLSSEEYNALQARLSYVHTKQPDTKDTSTKNRGRDTDKFNKTGTGSAPVRVAPRQKRDSVQSKILRSPIIHDFIKKRNEDLLVLDKDKDKDKK
jgi:hypothetical protein